MASDRELILLLQDGSLEALGELYDRHKNMVYRTAIAITGDKEAAADLLQDVFLRLHRFSHHIDPSRPLEPWIYRVTTNLAYTWVRRNQRWLKPLVEVTEWLIDTKKSNGPTSIHEDDVQQVHACISALPLPQRVVVVLYYIDDLPIQEIAEILEVPVGTVKSRLHYGREALKKQLGLEASGKLIDFNFEFT